MNKHHERQFAVLIIGRTTSWCGYCGRDADPTEKGHYTLLGFGQQNGEPGCQVVWTMVTPDGYGAGIEEAVRAMRPDLTFLEP